LASCELADRNDEGGVADFLTQTQGPWRVELFRTMHRDAVRGTTEQSAKHSDRGGIRAEVGMEVLHAYVGQLATEVACFGQEDQVP
jgi:hypothetical protein